MTENVREQILRFLDKRGGRAPLISIKRNFFYDTSAEEFFEVIRDMKEKGLIEVRPYGEFDVLNVFLTKYSLSVLRALDELKN